MVSWGDVWDVGKWALPGYAGYRGVKALTGPNPGEEDRQGARGQAEAAGKFADQGERGFRQTGLESDQARQYLRDLAEGKNSVSAEQLRQGTQQNLAAQRSMAASAAPANAAMAARTAAMQGAKLGYGESGQAAVAGLQERQGAQQMLNEMILRKRQQELDAANNARQNSLSGYNANAQNPGKGFFERNGEALKNVGTLVAMSDKRLKTEIADADDESREVIDGLKAYTFKYKDQKHGKGKQLGIIAQDLERAGLGHTVIETREGKAVHGAKLATSNTAMIAALGKRIAQLEGKSK